MQSTWVGRGGFAQVTDVAFGAVGQVEVQQAWLLPEASRVISYPLSTAQGVLGKLHTGGTLPEARSKTLHIKNSTWQAAGWPHLS